MIVLIPAYEPDERLLSLIDGLITAAPGVTVVVVDDGSGPRYARLFDAAHAAGCLLLRHLPNRGKGYALKRGFTFIAQAFPGQDVVCADSDGQHVVSDILKVAAELRRRPGAVVLGSRRFSGTVPLRSRLGNAATRRLVALVSGLRVLDSQTGLRGYPAGLVSWLTGIPGDRFEYEMRALLASHRAGHEIVEVPIETVYLEGNASSHFRPVVDSVRVYGPLARFSLSSLGAFGLDLALLLGLQAATGNLLLAVVGARVASSAVNFAVNRRLVFAEGPRVPLGRAAVRYYTLAVVLLAANYVMLRALTAGIGVPLLPSKVVTEAALFVVSYLVQKWHVFTTRAPHPVRPDDGARRPAAEVVGSA